MSHKNNKYIKIIERNLRKMKDIFTQAYLNLLITESVNDNFNYDQEHKRFETELGEWQPLDLYQWDSEYQDEDDETGFVEYTLSYNDKVQVSLKKDGSLDVVDPDGNHKLFKRGAYKSVKAYLKKIFSILNKIDRMKELDSQDRVRK